MDPKKIRDKGQRPSPESWGSRPQPRLTCPWRAGSSPPRCGWTASCAWPSRVRDAGSRPRGARRQGPVQPQADRQTLDWAPRGGGPHREGELSAGAGESLPLHSPPPPPHVPGDADTASGRTNRRPGSHGGRGPPGPRRSLGTLGGVGAGPARAGVEGRGAPLEASGDAGCPWTCATGPCGRRAWSERLAVGLSVRWEAWASGSDAQAASCEEGSPGHQRLKRGRPCKGVNGMNE